MVSFPQVLGTVDQDVSCLIKNSATLAGSIFTIHVSQVHIDLPTLSSYDKQVIFISHQFLTCHMQNCSKASNCALFLIELNEYLFSGLLLSTFVARPYEVLSAFLEEHIYIALISQFYERVYMVISYAKPGFENTDVVCS